MPGPASEHPCQRLRVAISGATGGIGSATARRFLLSGADLILIDIDHTRLAALAAELGVDATLVVCDQRNDPEIEQAVAAAGAVDIFINSAGIITRKPLLDMRVDEIDAILETNIAGAIKMAIAMARPMAARGAGIILNLSSQHAFIGAANRGIYAASKAAIAQFTRTAAVEWAPLGIRVLGLAPGPVVSPMTAEAMQSDDYRRAVLERMPIGRFLSTGEMAEMIFQLCQPGFASVVGHTIVADGGSSQT